MIWLYNKWYKFTFETKQLAMHKNRVLKAKYESGDKA